MEKPQRDSPLSPFFPPNPQTLSSTWEQTKMSEMMEEYDMAREANQQRDS